jgi:hypothetical protein
MEVGAVLRFKESGSSQNFRITKRPNESFMGSCLEYIFLLDHPQQPEKYKILLAIKSMDNDKIKIDAKIGLAEKKIDYLKLF